MAKLLSYVHGAEVSKERRIQNHYSVEDLESALARRYEGVSLFDLPMQAIRFLEADHVVASPQQPQEE